MHFFLLNHLRAGLPTELRRVLNLQNQDELKLSNAFKLATIEARSLEKAKRASKVYATMLEDYEEAQMTPFSRVHLPPSKHQGGFKHSPLSKMVLNVSNPCHP